jgi:hypothetical protein
MLPKRSTLISGSASAWKKAGLGGWPVSSRGVLKVIALVAAAMDVALPSATLAASAKRCCLPDAFVKKKPAKATRVIAKSDLNQGDLHLMIIFFMGRFSVGGILDSELRKTPAVGSGLILQYDLALFFDPGLGYFPTCGKAVMPLAT